MYTYLGRHGILLRPWDMLLRAHPIGTPYFLAADTVQQTTPLTAEISAQEWRSTPHFGGGGWGIPSDRVTSG